MLKVMGQLVGSIEELRFQVVLLKQILLRAYRISRDGDAVRIPDLANGEDNFLCCCERQYQYICSEMICSGTVKLLRGITAMWSYLHVVTSLLPTMPRHIWLSSQRK